LLINVSRLLDILLDGKGQEGKDLLPCHMPTEIFKSYPLHIILLSWSNILTLPTLFSLKRKYRIYSLLQIAFPTQS
jgi:hypothetical protein